MKPIIDVSKHNGHLNWENIKPHIEGAIIRMGYRGYSITGEIIEDLEFKYNESECARLDIPREYYFFPNDLSFSECAESAVWIMYHLTQYKDVPITVWLDSEHASPKKTGRADNLSKRDRTSHLIDIIDIINQFFPSWSVGIYCSNSWMKDHLDYVWISEVKDVCGGKIPLWIARYNNMTKEPSYPFKYWQYTSNGSIPGECCAFDFSVRQGEKIEH